jgi:hypothetical protein
MSFKATTSQTLSDFRAKLDASAFSATPVAYPNVPFEQPADTPWMRINVVPGASRQRSIGGITNSWRQDGGVTVQIRVPEGKGTGDLYDLVDAVAGFFRGQQTENVRYRQVIVNEVGAVEGGYQANVSITFEDSYLF